MFTALATNIKKRRIPGFNESPGRKSKIRAHSDKASSRAPSEDGRSSHQTFGFKLGSGPSTDATMLDKCCG